MMQDNQESSSDRPESSDSGGGGRSGGSNGGSSDRSSFEQANQNGGPEQRVPQFVDMVIPDYDESSNANQAPSHQGGNQVARMPTSRERSGEGLQAGGEDGEEEDEDDGSLEEGSLGADSQDAIFNDDRSPSQPCIPNENDVLLDTPGGDDEGEHPGNLRYRAVVRHLAKKYTKVKIGYRRAAVQILVNAVKAQGGRFLKRTPDGLWKQVSNKKAYHKSSHAIRFTCKKVEIVSSARNRSKNKRRRSNNRMASAQDEQQNTNSETTSGSDYPATRPVEHERKSNLEIMSLRLQTKDETLRHLNLDLQTVNHDFIFPFAKALDSSELLSSLNLRLSHMNRTNANALAWGLKRCKSLRQVKLTYGKLSEKSSIVLAGLLDNSSIESLNLDENDIDSEQLKALCRMIYQAKDSKLQRLSLESNPFGDEGASFLAKLISSSRHLRFLNLGDNNLQAAGVAQIRAATKKKTSCLFEVSGLEAIQRNRKRAIGESTEDSNEEHANKKQRENPSSKPSAAASAAPVSSSQPSSSFGGSMRNQSSSNTSSSNETEMAPESSAGSDNGINHGTGSDDGAPTSSMNDSSDDSPSSSSN